MKVERRSQDKEQASNRRCSDLEAVVSLQDRPNRISGNMAPFHVFSGNFGSILHWNTLSRYFVNLLNEVGGQSPVSHCGGLVSSQDNANGICGEQRATGSDFSLSTSSYLC
jgi:hypothetical protein